MFNEGKQSLAGTKIRSKLAIFHFSFSGKYLHLWCLMYKSIIKLTLYVIFSYIIFNQYEDSSLEMVFVGEYFYQIVDCKDSDNEGYDVDIHNIS